MDTLASERGIDVGGDPRGAVAARRVGLAVLAVSSAIVGFWAEFAPKSFYDNFPGGGHHWVRVNGPYNEHFVRDFGQWNLAGLLLLVVALVVLDARLVRLVALAYLITAVPHLVYHAGHLDVYSSSDKVANMFALGAAAVIAAALAISPGARRT
jgi:hypothetical protein